MAGSSPDRTSATDSARATAALDRLAALHPKLIDLGLTRTFDLLRRLGNPQLRLPPVIHVAGTNGKGSVIALMRAMAEAAGLSVHVYTSPHLCRFNERIRLAGHLIADGALADLLEEVERANGDEAVTFFEVTTAAAFLAFSRSAADLLLLETGLGGALDSTNVLDRPAATIITPIARDHEHFLGSDLAGIAGQKAGIMRADTPCLCAAQDEVVMTALDDHAAVVGTRAVAIDRDIIWNGDRHGGLVVQADDHVLTLAPPGLYGHHQMQNAALAAATLHMAMPDLDFETGGQGSAAASWPGRLQRLDAGHLTQIAPGRAIWLDGAHNAHGATALAAALEQLSPSGKWHFVTGALNTRPPAEFLEKIAPLAASLHCVAIPDQPASLTAHELVKAATPLFSAAQPAASIGAALSAIASGDETDNAPVMICGSLYLAGHVLATNGTLPE